LLIVRPREGFRTALFVLSADGSETRLTNDDAWITGGSFSPDGSKVVYATTSVDGVEPSRIFLTDASGGTPEPLLTADYRWFPTIQHTYLTSLMVPTFSPDGTRIAYFDGMGDHSNSLRVVNVDGSGVSVLLPDMFNHSHIRSLAWSPDGTALVFDDDLGVFTVRADGSGLTRLPGGEGRPGGRSPSWSPDGSRIAYAGENGLVITDPGGKHAQEFGYASSGPWNPVQ
jgi:Tol biopolymer transport system component